MAHFLSSSVKHLSINRFLQSGVWLLLALQLLMVSEALGADAAQYYRAQVPVQSQSAKERSRAAGIGLKEVLVRVSGNPDIAHAPGVLAELTSASRYLEVFDYGKAVDTEGQPQQVLNLQYSAPLVDRLLFEKGQPFWPLNRPNTLVWLALDAPGQDRQLLVDPEHAAVVALKQAAQTRGIPVSWPLLDLDDRLAINVSDIWKLNDEAILNASQRYGMDTVLVGRLVESSAGTWLATWEYFHLGQNRVYDVRDAELSAVMVQGINPLADYLAGLYAVTPGQENATALVTKVSGISSFKAYAGLVAYLERQAIVSHFRVDQVHGDEIWLNLQLSGSLKQLQNAFALDGLISTEALKQYDSSPWMLSTLGTPDAPLVLYWQGRN